MLLDQWFKEAGSELNAENKFPKFLLTRHKTDPFTVETVGEVKIKIITTTEEEILLPGKWLREAGNVLNAEKKLPNFLLNRRQTKIFIAEIAGKRKDQIDSSFDLIKRKTSRIIRGVFI